MVYTRKQPSKKAPRLVIALAAIWLLGFGVYLADTEVDVPSENIRVDAAIVLTGGAGRVAKGAELLRRKATAKLLISGAHDSVEIGAVRRRHNLSEYMASCCLQLDRAAHNTVSNARRSLAWLDNNNAQSLALITADYHMPRAKMLFKALMPGREIIALATPSETSLLGKFREYNKLLLTWTQLQLGFIS